MRRVLLAGAMALALMGVPSSALGGAVRADDYKASYKAYVAAQEAGDAEAVRRHAVAAWSAARDTLEPGETLAILAQNALIETIWHDAEMAMPIAAQALALGEAGHGLSNMTLEELRVADAYLRAEASGTEADARALAEALARDRATGRALTPFAVAAHDAAFLLAMAAEQHGLAYDLMTPLVHELRAAGTPLGEAIAARDLLRAMAILTAGRRIDSALGREGRGGGWSRRERVLDAHVLIDHARLAFPAAPTLAEARQPAIDAHVWHGVVRSLAGGLKLNLERVHRFDSLDANPDDSVPLIDRPGIDDRDCSVEWTRQRMTYPKLDDLYLGGVLVGYDLTPDGAVTNARVVGEVPSGRFGPHVLEQVQLWRADVGDVPAPCLRDHSAMIIFTTG